MATNRRFMPVPPAAVWAALADAHDYAYWVVGSKGIRDADDDFPAVGTKLHHEVGVGPLTIRDESEVVEAHPPRWLRLRVKARPLGTATVTLELEPQAFGTAVTMVEHPDGLSAVLSLNPLTHVALKARNAESLTRLEELALRRSTA